MRIVIVGNGIAGNQVAFEIRNQSKTEDIHIFSAESVPEYDPCSLPYYLSKSIFIVVTENFRTFFRDLIKCIRKTNLF